MRANRVRELHGLSLGLRFWWRGRGGMGRWLHQRGYIGEDSRITDKGREALRNAVNDYSSRGRLTQVFPSHDAVVR